MTTQEKILDIAKKLYHNHLTPETATSLLSDFVFVPPYDVEELNEIVSKFNNGEIDLYNCIGMVWNKSYFIGATEGMKTQ